MGGLPGGSPFIKREVGFAVPSMVVGRPKRIRLSRARGWRLSEGAVNCARPGPWGNPFVVGVFGTREKCVEAHQALMSGLICVSCKTPSPDEQRAALDYAIAHIIEVRGRDLACWCRLDGKPCHVETLLVAANG